MWSGGQSSGAWKADRRRRRISFGPTWAGGWGGGKKREARRGNLEYIIENNFITPEEGGSGQDGGVNFGGGSAG